VTVWLNTAPSSTVPEYEEVLKAIILTSTMALPLCLGIPESAY